jgi:hypothetical protein
VINDELHMMSLHVMLFAGVMLMVVTLMMRISTI